MAEEIIDTPKYLIRVDIEKRLMMYSIKPGVIFEAEDAIQSREEILKRYPGVKFFVFAEAIDFFNSSREARKVSASKEHLDNVEFMAFYTAHYTIYLLAEIFMAVNKPAVPTSIFFNREQAMRWLEEKMSLSQ